MPSAPARSAARWIAVVDVYRNETMKQADIAICLKPGTDGAFACAVMHVLFRDRFADWDYLEKYTDAPHEFEAHLQDKTPEWAAAITGLAARRDRSLCQGGRRRPGAPSSASAMASSRSRNGAVYRDAAQLIASVTGAWRHEGGGAFHTNSAIFGLDKTLARGERHPAIPRSGSSTSRASARSFAASGALVRRAAGDGDARSRHQPDVGRAGPVEGQARTSAARTFSSACTSR